MKILGLERAGSLADFATSIANISYDLATIELLEWSYVKQAKSGWLNRNIFGLICTEEMTRSTLVLSAFVSSNACRLFGILFEKQPPQNLCIPSETSSIPSPYLAFDNRK